MGMRAKTMVNAFLGTLFRQDEVIEVRPIETWVDSVGRKHSRVLRAEWRWMTTTEVVGNMARLTRINQNERANVFMGVNPRRRRGECRKEGVACVRSFWADVDQVSVEDACHLFRDHGLPAPSVLVDSGHGAHAYWLLDNEIVLASGAARRSVESALRSIHRRLGIDATQDVSRLLRLPGFLNQKNARQGGIPAPCHLVYCNPATRYSWESLCGEIGSTESPSPKRDIVPSRATDLGSLSRASSLAVSCLCRQLENRVTDRSRRDFAVVCELVRLGLSERAIWELVCERSKFASDGWRYFQATYENACRCHSKLP